MTIDARKKKKKGPSVASIYIYIYIKLIMLYLIEDCCKFGSESNRRRSRICDDNQPVVPITSENASYESLWKFDFMCVFEVICADVVVHHKL